MRVIAGQLGGRLFESPGGHATHPMSDKIRGALFNVLGDIKHLTFLDAFAGTGAIGFEAISRGAESAQLVELDKTAYLTIKSNISTLGISDKVSVVRANIKGWSNNNQQLSYDVVVCDPPYDAVLETLIFKVARHVKQGGVLVLSWPSDDRIPAIPDMKVSQHKTYGNATLVFYIKTG
jgi:16S rRNA (guanine966-N2)-methyltransferase